VNSSPLNQNVKAPIPECSDLLALSKPTEAQIDRLTEILKALVLEYADLLALPHLTDSQTDRLLEILTLAQDSDILNNWITELDHASGHVFGYLEPENRKAYKDYCALLKERCSHSENIDCEVYRTNCEFVEKLQNPPLRKIVDPKAIKPEPEKPSVHC
jgi:hypothetical protein